MKHRAGSMLLGTALAATVVLLGGCNKPGQPNATNTPTPMATTAAGNVADVDVTANVKTALLRDEALKGLDIKVVTLKGDVRLSGTLLSQTQIDDAVKVAGAANGAHTVHNELTLKQ